MAEEKKAYDMEMRSQELKQQRSEMKKYFNSKSHGDISAKITSDLHTKIQDDPSVQEEHWCYHCTSPIDHLSSAMKKTIKDFLKLRRTTYPLEVATSECVSARNFSRLHKQLCKHRYCQTLALVDDNEGASFVLRGCAENFGAIDTKQLDEQEENTCTKLHKKLDIKECICKDRKYCYANGKGRISSSFRQLSTFPLMVIVVFVLL